MPRGDGTGPAGMGADDRKRYGLLRGICRTRICNRRIRHGPWTGFQKDVLYDRLAGFGRVTESFHMVLRLMPIKAQYMKWMKGKSCKTRPIFWKSSLKMCANGSKVLKKMNS